MTSSLFKNQSSRIVGATFLLLAAAAPSQATTLNNFSTYGDMMSGMRITANFWDGTSQTAIWRDTDDDSGGAFGSGWSLKESGNSFNSPWTLSNSGQGITSLIIDAISGNALFDNYPYLYGPLQTPDSAEGWEFQTLSGQAPSSYTYSDPIDISRGDLFGTLSLYWSGGFTGTMKFRADTDSGTNNDPVRPRDPEVRTSPPTLYFSGSTIYEGQSAATAMSATDPGSDAITFFLNGRDIGTDYNLSGTRSVAADLGFYADNGEYPLIAAARDEDGNYSNTVTSTLNVLNVAPTITGLDIPTIYEGQSAQGYMSATDPGADALSFYLTGNNTVIDLGTDYSTSGFRFGSGNLGEFADNGYIPYVGQVVDKDGGWGESVSGGLTVLNVAPSLNRFDLSSDTIYEGESVSASLSASDPGADFERFFINGQYIGTDFQTSGERWAETDLGPFDEGEYTFRAIARDKDGANSDRLIRTLTVLNAEPTITDLTQNLTIDLGNLFDFTANATDPGNDTLTYNWDLNADGIYDDLTGSSGEWSFADAGTYDVGLQVSDGDGGYAYSSFAVNVVAPGTGSNPITVPDPATVPEPTSVLGVLGLGAFGVRLVSKYKRQHKAEKYKL